MFWVFGIFFLIFIVADATGKMPDGLLQLNLQAMGNMDECLDIDVKHPGEGTEPFKYEWLHLGPLHLHSAKGCSICGTKE